MRTLDMEAIRLGRGSHSPADAIGDRNACVMEAVAWVAGEPWTDKPQCASPVIATFLRSWNDALDDTDRQQLRRWVLPLVGTAASAEIEDRRAWMACDWLVRTHTPAWLRRAGLVDDAAALESLPELTSTELVEAALPVIRRARVSALAAWGGAGAGAWDAAGAGAWDATWGGAGAGAWDAAWGGAGAAGAWDAARAGAWAAAGAAAGAAAWDAAWDAARAGARDAARDAARAALSDTVVELQASAHDLIGRMVALSPGGAA